MRRLLLLAALASPLAAQYTLYTCMAITKEYVVGAKLPPSGLFLRSAAGEWRHTGYDHPFLFALDYDPRDPATLYLAAGNGLIRASDHGKKWKILTGSDVTELQDVSVDRNAPGTIYFSHTAGIKVSHDRGATWNDASASLCKLLELLAPVRRPLSELVADLPAPTLVHRQLACPWALKGVVMRVLTERLRDRKLDLTDGIKVFGERGWAQILPDPDEPLMHIYAEGKTEEDSKALEAEFRAMVEEIMQTESAAATA